MSLTAEIRGVLTAGEKNREQLLALCDSARDDKQLAQNLSVLKAKHKVDSRRDDQGVYWYRLDKWPEDSIRGAAPPPSAGGKQKRKAKAPAAPRPAAPVHTTALPNGAPHFAILSDGTLSLLQGEHRVDLAPAHFVQLREFIEKTEQVWSPV